MAPRSGATACYALGRSTGTRADSTPLTKRPESSVEKRLASSTASLRITATGVPRLPSNSNPAIRNTVRSIAGIRARVQPRACSEMASSRRALFASTPSTRNVVRSSGSEICAANTSAAGIPFVSASYSSIIARSRESERSSSTGRVRRRDTSDPGDVIAAASIGPDAVARVDEQRDLHDETCLERRRLSCARHTIALDTRFGVGDGQLDRGRNLDRDDLTLVERDDRDRLLNHVVGGVAERSRCNMQLVVVVGVHEHVLVAVAIEKLHVLLLQQRLLDSDTGVERSIEHIARLDVAQLGAHERAAFAGLDVLELDDLEEPVVELQCDSVLQVVGGDGGHGESFGDAVSTRHPLSVTTTRSSTRIPPNRSR